ncbi:putative F-box protein At4g17565 [Tripterygium wilfordii]|uniref:putative F-box protein At4g17565 n=1 Tax=Tripterygium wilfordii TaxID=458696 RepID=UPI0018F84764|nr:putative F-box protein At4g17565 [Tripterygium wilfordii]
MAALNCNKRRRIISEQEDHDLTEPDWSGLQPELVEFILSKLSIINMIRCQAVCSAWCLVVKTISSSGFSPWLIVRDDYDAGSFCFFSTAEEDKIFKIKKHESVGRRDRCIGSSNGWLVLWDDRWVPYLLNPFSQVRIQLPSFPWLQHAHVRQHRVSRYFLFRKVILLSNPSQDKNNHAVVVIYWNMHSRATKLCFCKNGDREWTDIDGNLEVYSDIVCHNDMLYAIGKDCSIEAWDCRGPRPIKILSLKPLLESRQQTGMEKFIDGRYHKIKNKYYLVESSGKLLLVVRNTYYLPYRMLYFDVYELDFNEERWVLVESIGDRVLFLGKNHSMSMSAAKSFPGCEGDSIHFTSDYRTNGHYEVGVFSLGRETVKPYTVKVRRPPLWITPNMW